ncbi:MAG: protein phosphatase 2C domain-containing protein [Victivallales bacterium]|nr:protein phosphatase 2C domain-containing protein [Victivallales bacterium]
MVREVWKSFGASVRGPGHVRAAIPNQDAFCIKRYDWGKVAVVSDGVGSCSTSEYGAKAVCRAVSLVSGRFDFQNGGISSLVEQFHEQWLLSIMPFKPETSSATCVFSICFNDSSTVLLGMLGDGLAAVLKSDGTYFELTEDKNDGFSNQTGAFSPWTRPENWRSASFGAGECKAVLLCTDGIADDLLPEQHENFVRHIYERGHSCPVETSTRELRKMLENWPVPKHSDDKTLVCIYQCEEDA